MNSGTEYDHTVPGHPIMASARALLGAGESQLELEMKDSSCSSSSIDFLHRKSDLHPLVVEKIVKTLLLGVFLPKNVLRTKLIVIIWSKFSLFYWSNLIFSLLWLLAFRKAYFSSRNPVGILTNS